jgi:DNA-binding CsgD family transcriptional regulator
MSAYAVERAEERVAELAVHGLDVADFFRAAGEAIATAVPSFGPAGWFTLDPGSLLITSYVNDAQPEIEDELLRWEYQEEDVNKATDVARSRLGVSTLHEATGGDVRSSYSYSCLQRYGLEQEVRVALRNRAGETWGLLSLVRELGAPLFDDDELRFLRGVAPHLARGTQRGLLVGEATDPDLPDAPGLVVLDADGNVDSLTPGVERWLEELPSTRGEVGLPTSVVAVATQALRTATHPDVPAETAVARVLSTSGRWVVLHGTALVAAGRARTAVIVEPAHPARILPLLFSAYGLTRREQEVTQLVLRGEPTGRIARQLSVSPHTVQRHLSNIFDKTGVRSRSDLVGKVFFAHYEPRVRDNERRVQDHRQIRGGPFPAGAARGHAHRLAPPQDRLRSNRSQT